VAGRAPRRHRLLARINAVFLVSYTGGNVGVTADVLHTSLRDAALWWVGTDCRDLLVQAAPSMPPVTLSEDMVPDQHGFAFLQRPIVGQDALHPGVTVDLDAIHWYPLTVEGRDCVSISMWSVTDADPPMPWGRSDWPHGSDTDQHARLMAPVASASIEEDRRLLAALWQLTSQRELIQTSEQRPYRAAAKRIQRRGYEPAPVRLLSLNPKQQRRSPTTTTTGTRNYTHRWYVKPHWRQQPYGPGRSLRKATYIAEQIRGPQDKPIRARDTVKFWTKP
jgi:hypothetical protein